MSRLGPTGLTQLLTNIKTWVTTKLGNYVTTDTTQTVTGKKLFTASSIQLDSIVSMSGSTMFIDTSAAAPRGEFPAEAHHVGRIYIGDNTSYNGAWFIVDPTIDTNKAYYRMVTTNPDNTDSTRFSITWDGTKTGARCRKNVSMGDLLPAANNTYNLGADDQKWDIGYIHNLIGSNKENASEDANNYYSTTSGSHMTFYTTTNGGTKLSNVPAAVNTHLESRTIRYLSSSDWIVEQICHNSFGLYYRKGTNGTWEDWKTFAFTNSNITGTAANVTGTVAIANGGTGATTRLSAVKNLTNESVGTPTHFLAITTNYAKAGYTTVAQAKTVLGITGDMGSHSDSEYVHKTGDESISGDKNFQGLLTTIPNASLWPNVSNTTDDITFLGRSVIHIEYKSSGQLTDLSGGAWGVAELGAGCFFFRINNGADIRFKNLATGDVNRIPVVSGTNRFINDVTPNEDNTYSLGTSSLRWSSCYSNAYYLGTTAFGDIVTHNASEFLTSHQSLSSCVKNVVTNNQTIKSTGITRGTAPSSAQTFGIAFSDNNNKFIGNIYGQYATDKSTYVGLYAYKGTTTANGDNASVRVGYDASGNAYTYAPTPATTDNSTQIATTAFVKAQGYLTSHQSLANYALDANVVHTSGDETIAGKKSFNAMPSILGSYLGNEFSTNARTCLYLKSNRDTDGQSGIYFSKFRQNVAQGALTGSNLVCLTLDVLENSVRTNSCIAINFRYFENDVPTKIYVIPNASMTSYIGTADNPWTSIYGTNIYGSFTGNLTGDVTGNASSATEFSANKDVTLTGDVTGTASSKAGWSVATTLANSGVTAGTYGPSADVTGNNNATISVPEITVDAKGRVTSVTNRTLTCKNNTYNVYNKTLTIQKNGTNVATFTSNSNTNVTANITVPTKTSDLTNDSNFVVSSSLADVVHKSGNETISGNKTFSSINGVEPGSLSLPDLDNGIDISGFITGGNSHNEYTPIVDGWISVILKSTSGGLGVFLYQGDMGNGHYSSTSLFNEGEPCVMASLPVKAGIVVNIDSRYGKYNYVYSAKFFPCRGNV